MATCGRMTAGVLAALTGLTALQAAAAPTAHLVEVIINGVPADVAVLLNDGPALYLPTDFLADIGLAAPTPAIRFHQRSYAPVSAIDGASVQLNAATGTLMVQCDERCYGHHRYNPPAVMKPQPGSGGSGWFLNYDVFAESSSLEDLAGGSWEAGTTLAGGTFTSSAVCATAGPCAHLETRWQRDDPQQLRRTVLGDTHTQSGWLGRPARYSGFKWGTDFSLRPDLVTFPLPDYSAGSLLPSTVDVYVNGVHRSTRNVAPGVFDLTDLPVLSGAGSATVIMTDISGLQRQATVDYYVEPTLLRPGLDSYSVEAGVLRERFGDHSAQHGSAFAAGTWRRGITQRLTGAARWETARRHHSAAGELILGRAGLGSVSGALIASRHEGRQGYGFGIGYHWQSPRFSATVRSEGYSSGFRHLGQGDQELQPQLRWLGGMSYRHRSMGTLALRWVREVRRYGPAWDTWSLQHSLTTAGLALRLLAWRASGTDRGGVAATVTRRFGTVTSSLRSSHQDSNSETSLTVRSDAPVAGGWGYRAETALDDDRYWQSSASYRSRRGDVHVEAARNDTARAVRVRASGGVAGFPGTPRLTPPLRGSYALVDVSNPGVPVYRNGQPVGATDRDGRLVVTELLPFQRNRISLHPEDLPLELSAKREHIEVVPARRSGHVLSFGVTRRQPIDINVRREDGSWLPAGAVLMAGANRSLPVGRRGRVYAENLELPETLRFGHGSSACLVALTAAQAVQSGSIVTCRRR